MKTSTNLDEQQFKKALSPPSMSAQSPNHDPAKSKRAKSKRSSKRNAVEKKQPSETATDARKSRRRKKKSTENPQDNAEATSNNSKKKTKTSTDESTEPEFKPRPPTEEETTFMGSSEDEFKADSEEEDQFEIEPATPRRLQRRISFGGSGLYPYRQDSFRGLDLECGDETSQAGHSNRTLHANNFRRNFEHSPNTPGRRRLSFQSSRSQRSLYGESPARRLSFLASSIKSFLSIGSEFMDPRDQSTGRRTAFRNSRGNDQNKNFRISKNPRKMKAERIEAFFYNHGMEIALGVLYLAINILAAAHGAYQFTSFSGWTTEDDILRITLPIARAGGRLVTLNCAILLLTACKYLWTYIRTYVAPVLPIGFPIDNIMPKYHRYVALTVIVSGCIIHTLPQIVNYATRSITIDHEGFRIWTFGDGFATKQLLLTGTLLTVIFSTFFVTTLKCFRKTAAGFRWFWFFHMGGIATAYPLLLIHGTCRGRPIFLYFALTPLVLYLFDITMRRYNISTTEVLEMKTHDDEGQQITELTIKCPDDFEYTPGQYAELNFLPISKREWHPFTIASAPKEGDDKTENNLVFYIKNSGRWTEALYKYATTFEEHKTKIAPQIQMRGPHGAPSMNYFEYKHIVVIGSGVGVTPLLSIWKYLVAKGQKMLFNPSSMDDPLFSQFVGNDFFDDDDMDETILGEDEEGSNSKIRSTCLFLEKILESMTVSMSLLVLFVLGETITFVLQMFGYIEIANILGSTLSLIALGFHGSTVIVSTIALGCSYFKTFKCCIEFTIIFSDAIATIALWFSMKSYAEDIVGAATMQSVSTSTIYFVFFGFVVALHAIRIFHIFYTTLKPTSHDVDDEASDSIDESFRSLTISYQSRTSTVRQEICSIEGILINRMYSNMKFAARSLLRPIAEDGLSNLFSMQFYGTREKPKDRDQSESGLISDMMESESFGLDIRNRVCKHTHDDYFHTGRPNWNKIFLKAIAKAHQQNPKGESVGVFFCGSPAIAKDLQVAAAEVTARHQFSMKHLDGKPCKCKLIVHSENF